jgi:tRNA/rRNA methyltransferase
MNSNNDNNEQQTSQFTSLNQDKGRYFNSYKDAETKEGAYEAAKTLPVSLPCIILVQPFLDQNVGSVSRAMLNFGLTELRVVDPQCNILSDNALALAVGSSDILKNAKIFKTLAECCSDLQTVMATTVRPRDMTQTILSPSGAAKAALTLTNDVKTGIMFGPERSGLTNEDVAFADTIISIPTFKRFSSLNLAQAVNIVCFEIWKRQQELTESNPPEYWLQPRDGQRYAKKEELLAFFERMESKLDERSFQVDENRRMLLYRNLRNIFQRVSLTKSDVDLLQGVVTTLIKNPNDITKND